MSGADRFEAFVVAHEDAVYGVAVRLLGRPADAEDVAQMVFLKAWERFAMLDGNPAAGGWLRTVATNLCLNELTRHRRRWRLFSEMRPADRDAADAPAFEETLATDAVGIDVVMADADRRRALEAALRALPDAQRVPLVLFHFEQMSYQDIAARLQVSLGKVKTDIHRGRLALARGLTEAGETTT